LRSQQARLALLQALLDTGEEALGRRHPWPGWDASVAEYIMQVVEEHESEHRAAVLAALTNMQLQDNTGLTELQGSIFEEGCTRESLARQRRYF
jgi:formate dehydrogenase maturation protein FdhE